MTYKFAMKKKVTQSTSNGYRPSPWRAKEGSIPFARLKPCISEHFARSVQCIAILLVKHSRSFACNLQFPPYIYVHISITGSAMPAPEDKPASQPAYDFTTCRITGRTQRVSCASRRPSPLQLCLAASDITGIMRSSDQVSSVSGLASSSTS